MTVTTIEPIIITANASASVGFLIFLFPYFGEQGGNRTHVSGVAVHCITILPLAQIPPPR